MESKSIGLPIGIDLGTVFSSVGVWQQGKVEIISNDEGNTLIPSFVGFNNTGRILGDAAKTQCNVNPQNTIFGVKSLLGRRFDDPLTKERLMNQSFRIVNFNGRPKYQVDWCGEIKYFTPEDICGMILNNLKGLAKHYITSPVADVVISSPAYFNSFQRKAIRDAAIIAGCNVLRIISKPIAAALAYKCFDGNVRKQKHILIFDVGCEATEVSVVIASEESVEIKAVTFDQGFGGRDFDNRLLKLLINELKRKHKIDVKSHSLQKILSAAQQAKHTLSSSLEVEIKIDGFLGQIEFCTKVTRSKFEELCSDLFCKTLVLVKRVINEAKLTPSSIDDIVLIGGSTRIPKIKNILQNFFPDKTMSLNFPNDPQLAVTYGTVTFAAILGRDTSIGPQIRMSPDSLKDVTPFSLTIGIPGEEISKIINRKTKFPCKQSNTFTIENDGQTSITMNVYEGERNVSTENNLLFILEISKIPPASSRFHKITVNFSIDENGILKVTAEEKNSRTSEQLQVVIDRYKGLPKEDKLGTKEAGKGEEGDSETGLQLSGTKRKMSDSE